MAIAMSCLPDHPILTYITKSHKKEQIWKNEKALCTRCSKLDYPTHIEKW